MAAYYIFNNNHQHGVHVLTIHFAEKCSKSDRLYTSLSLCVDSAGPGKGWWPYRNECVCYILMMNPPEKQQQCHTASDGESVHKLSTRHHFKIQVVLSLPLLFQTTCASTC